MARDLARLRAVRFRRCVNDMARFFPDDDEGLVAASFAGPVCLRCPSYRSPIRDTIANPVTFRTQLAE